MILLDLSVITTLLNKTALEKGSVLDVLIIHLCSKSVLRA